MKQQLKKNDFDILDSIRGIAALYVVIAHCRGTLWIGGSQFTAMFPRNKWDAGDYFMFGSSMLTRLAVEFVIVFFVLSGFSISHSLSSNQSPLPFYKRRLIRIYPSYIAALVWAGIIYAFTKALFPQWYDGSNTQYAYIRTIEMNDYFNPVVMIKNLFYMPMHGFIGPFWSLTYEVMFYLLAPFLLRRVNLYVTISAILFLIGFFAPEQVMKLSLPLYIHEFLFTYNIYFAVGVFFYSRYHIISQWFTSYTKNEFLVIIGGFLLIMLGANIYLKIENTFTFIEASMLSVMLIVFFLKFQLRIPFLVNVGAFSYTLYITHFASIYLYLALYWWIARPSVPYITNYFVWIPAVAFVVGLAYLQYILIEKKTKHLLNALRRNPAKADEIKHKAP